MSGLLVSYIADLANEIRTEVSEQLLPADKSDLLFLLYALLLLVKDEDVGPEDVHNAWSVWMTSLGEPHESLVPFGELSHTTKAEDEPYVKR